MSASTFISTLLTLAVVGPAAIAQDPGKPGAGTAGKAGAVDEEKGDEEEAKIIDLPEEEVIEEVDALYERALSRESGDFPALAQERKRRAMRELGLFPHPYTVKKLEQALADRKLEGYLKQAAAEALGHMKFARKEVSAWLIQRIPKLWKEPEALVGVANALGELGLPGSRKERQQAKERQQVYEYFKHKDDAVYISMIAALGSMKDVQSLPKLYEIFAQYGHKSTAGVSVRVDTGAAGTKDQRAAEARGRGMYKRARADRREGALHAAKQAVFQITGQEFEYHDELFEWLEENHKKIGLKDFKMRKK